jgi:hypothetical protein
MNRAFTILGGILTFVVLAVTTWAIALRIGVPVPLGGCGGAVE